MEEHLLLCAWCQDRLDNLEPQARLMRAALAAASVREEGRGWFTWLRPQLWSVAAGIAVAVVCAFLFIHSKPAVAPLALLQLSAIRGDIPATGIASETDLSLTDAPPQSNLRVEVVNETGTVVWSSPVTGTSVKVVTQLSPGTYFVRLYDNSGALLHEYGFRVRGNI